LPGNIGLWRLPLPRDRAETEAFQEFIEKKGKFARKRVILPFGGAGAPREINFQIMKE
jgi:hypothetical protein